MTYEACKILITNKAYLSVEDIHTKLDVFLLNSPPDYG
nr:MAG TPA: hypothetical protein [Caudoviricetes sp.]